MNGSLVNLCEARTKYLKCNETKNLNDVSCLAQQENTKQQQKLMVYDTHRNKKKKIKEEWWGHRTTHPHINRIIFTIHSLYMM